MFWLSLLLLLHVALTAKDKPKLIPHHRIPVDFQFSPLAQPLVSVDAANIERRVFYGTKVDLGAVPFIVSLVRMYNDRRYSLCGGSILNPYWIVTAAHCVVHNDSLCDMCVSASHLAPKNTLTITAGDNELFAYDGMEQKLYPKQIFVHKDYSDINLENDIALIRLEAPIVFNSNISNIALSTSLPDQGTTLFVAGWGATDLGDADELGKISYGFPTTSECQTRYGSGLKDSMWCSGDAPMTYSYRAGQGDSGGPVYHQYNNTYYLDGLVSWGPPEPIAAGDYDVNTNVPYLNTWITDTQASYVDVEPLLATESPATYTWNNSAIRYTHQPFYLTCNNTANCKVEVTIVTHDFSLDQGTTLTVHGGHTSRSPILSVINIETVGTPQYTSSTSDMLLEVLTGDQAQLVSFTINYKSVDTSDTSQGTCGIYHQTGANYFTKCATVAECYNPTEECDEYNDCSDYSDEESCRYYSNIPVSDDAVGCYGSDYKCSNAWCVRDRFVCDGYNDCLDGGDESEGACTPAPTITIVTIILAVVAGIILIVLCCFSVNMVNSLRSARSRRSIRMSGS